MVWYTESCQLWTSRNQRCWAQGEKGSDRTNSPSILGITYLWQYISSRHYNTSNFWSGFPGARCRPCFCTLCQSMYRNDGGKWRQLSADIFLSRWYSTFSCRPIEKPSWQLEIKALRSSQDLNLGLLNAGQLSHWSSGIGAEDKWYISIDTLTGIQKTQIQILAGSQCLFSPLNNSAINTSFVVITLCSS